MNGDPLEFQRDMAFTLHVMQNGQEQCVTLDASNDFQETICDLQPGYTMVEESGCTGYVTRDSMMREKPRMAALICCRRKMNSS